MDLKESKQKLEENLASIEEIRGLLWLTKETRKNSKVRRRNQSIKFLE